MTFLIAYDIADPKRLRRVARLLEKHALRSQYSVFLFRGTEDELTELVRAAAVLMDKDSDRIQAWRLAATERPEGRSHGITTSIFPAGVVIGRRSVRTVERASPKSTNED